MKLIDEDEEEVWLPVKEYEDRYAISNKGRIKSLERVNNYGRRIKEKILKASMTSTGYRLVTLLKDGKIKGVTIHRLVANAFLPNTKKEPCINHKDGNKLNNNVENLEWCGYSFNNKHALDNGLRKPAWSGKFNSNHPRSRKIVQYTIDMGKVKEWNSIREASKFFGVSEGGICDCCKGNHKTFHGYVWRYANE